MSEKDIDLRQGVATRLQAIRAEFHLDSLTSFAEAVGASNSTVNQWLGAANLPRVPEMITLCERTNLTLDWIYRGAVVAVDDNLVRRLRSRIRRGKIVERIQRAPRGSKMTPAEIDAEVDAEEAKEDLD